MYIDETHPEYVGALARGLSVIASFSAHTPEMTLSGIAQKTNIPAASVRRSLLTLQALGYVGCVGRHYHLRAKILELGIAGLEAMGVKQVVRPVLTTLANTTGDAVAMAVLSEGQVMYVAHVPSAHRVQFSATIGSRLPVLSTSLGRVLLGGLLPTERDAVIAAAPVEPYTSRTITDRALLREDIEASAQRGYSIVEEQLEYGVTAVAVPIKNEDGRVVAAINCTSIRNEEAEAVLVGRLPSLRSASAEISAALTRFPALAHAILP